MKWHSGHRLKKRMMKRMSLLMSMNRRSRWKKLMMFWAQLDQVGQVPFLNLLGWSGCGGDEVVSCSGSTDHRDLQGLHCQPWVCAPSDLGEVKGFNEAVSLNWGKSKIFWNFQMDGRSDLFFFFLKKLTFLSHRTMAHGLVSNFDLGLHQVVVGHPVKKPSWHHNYHQPGGSSSRKFPIVFSFQ